VAPDASDSFRFTGYPVRVHAGPDAIGKLAEEAGRVGAQRILVVCGQSVMTNTDLVQRVKEALGERVAGVFAGGKTGSPLTSVLEGVAVAREVNADGIVAVGGGSAVVTARGITILLAERGTAQELCTQYPEGKPPVSPRLMAPKIPNFIVLTTATTAVTRAGAALIDPESGHRLELFDPKTRPAAVIWDGQALMTASPWLCLNASASCFTGVAAALQRTGLNPLAESDLLEALRLLKDNLPLVKSNDPRVRINLCAAAFLYNRATDAGAGGSALGVVTALAHSLDTRYPECGHGDAYSILTAPGMRFNLEANTAGQARFAAAMGVKKDGMDDRQAAASAADAIGEMFRGLDLPVKLSQVGVTEDGIDQIAEDAMTDFGLHRNVRKIQNVDELKGILATVR
jgi:alcohol dehydrogenase class IV